VEQISTCSLARTACRSGGCALEEAAASRKSMTELAPGRYLAYGEEPKQYQASWQELSLPLQI